MASVLCSRRPAVCQAATRCGAANDSRGNVRGWDHSKWSSIIADRFREPELSKLTMGRTRILLARGYVLAGIGFTV